MELSSSSKNYADCHEHPLLLVLNSEQLMIKDESGDPVLPDCSRCGEKVSVEAPSLRCVEDDCAGFYLHKACAEVPLELNHPFHPHHPLLLMDPSLLGEEPGYSSRSYICDFCSKRGDRFVYHCSCGLDFHIKCALFTFNIAQNNLKELLQHVPLQDPLIISTTENDDQQPEDVSKCFGCWEPLANYTHFSPDCGFHLHNRCAELPLKTNYMYHRKHPLVLKFNSQRLPCKICAATPRKGYVYGCSSCKFVVHIECMLSLLPSPSLPLVIEDNLHPSHPFNLFPRRASFICDACGTDGVYAAYICCTRGIIVHKNCISLPQIIKSKWHDHRILHNYFRPDDFTTGSDCMSCNKEVNPEHGNYCCSICHIMFHVNCVTGGEDSYFIVSHEDEDEMSYESSITILETNDAGEATKIQHFKHMHSLMLSPFVEGCERSCDGCMLPISDPFYYCSQRDFFLHKACAELPKKKHLWHHGGRELLVLTSENLFKCKECGQVSSAFSYECSECEESICLQCVIALTPGAHTSSKHEHPLFMYRDYKGKCNGCGTGYRASGAFRCKKKDCNFVLDRQCFSLPVTARHICDEHLLSLTYHDHNSYSGSHYCDICEGSRNPNSWFYHCATCDTSGHVHCALGKYPFVKLGSIYGEGNDHPLTFVKKNYYYPDCEECGKPCVDLSLECAESGCNYIAHWDCVAPSHLKGDPLWQWWRDL